MSVVQVYKDAYRVTKSKFFFRPLSNSISPAWNRKHESDQNPQ